MCLQIMGSNRLHVMHARDTLFKVQYPKSSVDYNKRYTYIIIVIQYNSFYIMRYDNNPII